MKKFIAIMLALVYILSGCVSDGIGLGESIFLCFFGMILLGVIILMWNVGEILVFLLGIFSILIFFGRSFLNNKFGEEGDITTWIFLIAGIILIALFFIIAKIKKRL